MDNPIYTYNRFTQLLHWVSALLIIFLFIMGQIMTNDSGSDVQVQQYRIHVVLGLLVLALTVIRIVWLLIKHWPPIPADLASWRKQAFLWIHILLLVVVVAMVFSGVNILLQSGIGLSLANIAPDKIGDIVPVSVHVFASRALLALFIVHVVGVISYQMTKGDALGRMGIPWFGRKYAQ